MAVRPTKKPAKNNSKKRTPADAKTLLSKNRKLKTPKYRSFRLQKRIKATAPKLPSIWRLFRTSVSTLWAHKKLFAGVVVVYGLLNILFVTGINAGGSISGLKTSLQQVTDGSLNTGAALFAYMLGNTGSATGNGAGYQVILAVLASLAVIWTLRQVYAKVTIKVRDAYYQSMRPLVPFLLVVAAIGLQLIPLLLGAILYSTAVGGGVAVFLVEKIMWGVLFALLALLSLYMVSSSVFALYIVTLPDMTPMRALRSARDLVANRRWSVVRKIIIIPIIFLVLAAVIMIPVILFLTPIAPWMMFALFMIAIAIFHSYMYALYRALL